MSDQTAFCGKIPLAENSRLIKSFIYFVPSEKNKTWSLSKKWFLRLQTDCILLLLQHEHVFIVTGHFVFWMNEVKICVNINNMKDTVHSGAIY